MKKYLKDLEAELKKNSLSDEEIDEIIADHAEMIESAINEGLSDEELEAKFGDPKAVAEELADFSEKAEKKTKKESKEEVKNLEFSEINDNYNVEIALINEDVKVRVHELDTIVVELVGNIKVDRYDIYFKENTFYLGRKRGVEVRSYFERSAKKKFIVHLPKAKPVMNFKFKGINGDGIIKHIVSSEFIIGTNNGDLKIKDLTTGQISVNSVNGDLSLESISCDDFKLSLVSGDIKANKVKIKNDFKANTVSGDMELEEFECNDLTLRTVSGDVSGKEVYPKEISLTTVSGDIKITNSRDEEIKIRRKKAVSGDIKIKVA